MNKALLFSAVTVALGCGSGSNGDTTTSTTTGSQGGSGGETAAGGGGAGADGGAGGTGGAGGVGGGVSCLDEGHAAGERYSLRDHCNFCDCLADGSSACTNRTCPAKGPGCTYDGVARAYAERFPSTDGVNECVCAASGLACTRRDSNLPEEGAILLESMNEPCGHDMTFTGATVLSNMPTRDFSGAFPYNHVGIYPESRPDTTMRVRVVYEGGFVVCRIPDPSQPAIDMEVVVEWIGEDGVFDEGHHTYLRRNNFGFVDAWLTNSATPHGALDGTYTPNCLDPNGLSFSAQVNADGTADGSIMKVCETDFMVPVGSVSFTP